METKMAPVILGEERVRGRKFLRCKCRCGKEFLASSYRIRIGRTVSCGCWRDNGGKNRTHGLADKIPEYNIWQAMKHRCYLTTCKDYPNYGGRGIIVCKQWLESFEVFLADVGFRPSALHTIDRYPNVNGNYEPGNVRWATQVEQVRNRRKSTNLTLNGVTQHAKVWADELGISYSTIMTRVGRGWPVERVLKKW